MNFQQSKFGLCCEPLNLFSATKEASIEGALLDTLNIFQQMWISNVDRKVEGFVETYSTNFIRVAQWVLQAERAQVRRSLGESC